MSSSVDAAPNGATFSNPIRFVPMFTRSALLMTIFAVTVMPSTARASGLLIEPTSAPAEASSSDLLDVSCISQASCLAVGNAERTGESGGAESLGAFAELWGGAEWALIQAQVPAAGTPSLSGVSCVSATFCVAVGSVTDSDHTTALVESWDGDMWTRMPAPSPDQSGLAGVSCASATSCVAVGQDDARPLAERWNGIDWIVLKTASLPSPHYGALSAVSCLSDDMCVAAGQYQALNETAAAAPGALVERWNGTHWTLQHANPRPIRSDSTLSGIACVSASSCVAVGASWPEEGNGYPGKPLAEHWNGRTWEITTSAMVPRAGGELESVSCASATSCTAVGQLNPGAYPLPHDRLPPWKSSLLAERWDGTRWSVEPTQQSGNTNNESGPMFSGISCVAPAFCAAVGNSASGAVRVALAEG